MAHRMHPPKLKALTLALSAALVSMAPAVALASPPACPGPISISLTTTVAWNSGDCSITSSGSATSQNTGLTANGNANGTLTNNGVISGTLYAINNGSGTISALNNSGTITGTVVGAVGILNTPGATINMLDNQANGTINGSYAGIRSFGSIGTLTNEVGGVISGGNYAIIGNGGGIGTITNSGIITTASGGQYAIFNNAGTIQALDNSGTISGGVAGIYNNTSILTLTNDTTGSISGILFAISNSGGTVGLLTNNGAIISQGGGIVNDSASLITSLGNEGAISAATGIVNNGTIGSLTNSGMINSQGKGIANSGTITSLTNNGTINSSNDIGITNDTGTIGTLTNSGSISGAGFYALSNGGAIGVFNNSGVIRSSARTGINMSGTIGTLTNSGSISGAAMGLLNSGRIDALNNAGGGNISSTSSYAVYNSGTIGVLNNAGGGSISSGAAVGVFNAGAINTLVNNGNISGATGVRTQGTIGALVNNGTITGSVYAFYNAGSGTIGALTNTGLIAGNLRNTSVRDLNINGGTGAVFGTLTGFGGGVDAGHIGAISNVSANVIFGTGNLLLNDAIDVTGHAVVNAGATLQVNNTINITGNYTQNAGASLNIGVANGAVASGVVSADSGYGRLVVSGSTTFNAGATIALQKLNSYIFAQGQRFVVVQTANANAHYNADSLIYSAIGYNGSVTGASVIDTDNANNTDLILTVGAGGPINSALDPNASSSLGGLFNYTGTNAGMVNLFNAAAAIGGTSEANRAGAQLSPSATGTAVMQATQGATQAVNDVTSAHIDAQRVAQASGSGSSGIATGERAGDVAVWGQAFGGQANQSDRTDAAGFKADYNGMLVGIDTALNEQWRIGGLVNYANTSIANTGNNNGSSGHISAYGFTGYAGYAAEKWYLDLSAGVATQKVNTLRVVNFTGFSGGASGSFNGLQFGTSAQAGYPIKLNAVTTLTPIGGVTYSRLHQDGYTETGSAAALQIGSVSISSIKSELGAKLERVFKTSYGDMTPSAQLNWRHEYRYTGLRSVANFAADTTGSTGFTTQGAAPNRDTGVLVLGVTLARSENLSLAAHYTLEAAGSYTAQTADVRLRYQF